MKNIYIIFLLVITLGLSAQNRYWVNGSGNWDDTNHWSETSGGQAGVSIPDIRTNVYLINNTYTTINITDIAYANKITSSNTNINSSTGGVIILNDTTNNNLILSGNIEIEKNKSNGEKASGWDFTLSEQDVSCFGLCDGQITVTLTNSSNASFPIEIRMRNPSDLQPPTYVYFSNLQSSDFPYTITGLCASVQNYRFKLTDDDGDSPARQGIRVGAPDEITLDDYTQIDESCDGACDGQIKDLDIYSENGIQSYAWSDGTSADTAANLCDSNYSLTITDNNNCTEDFSFTLNDPTPIVVDDSSYTPYICDGGPNGWIQVDASGGTGTLTHNWDNGDTGDSISGLVAGTYNDTIIDANGCSIISGPYVLQDNAVITIDTTTHPPSCYGDSNGSIDFTINGGTADYNYHWEGPDSYTNDGTTSASGTISGLVAGTYNMTVTDDVQCTKTITVVLHQNDSLIANGSHTDISCNGANDGSITFNPIGGDGTYHYNWSIGGGDVSSQNGLSAGDVTVTITDGNGCALTAPGDTTITINEPEQLYAHGTHADVSCSGANDGSITFTPIGGDGTYHYNWSIGGGDVSSQNGLAGGNVTVTITDGNGCTLVAPGDTTITINEPEQLYAHGTHSDISCNGANDGNITFTPIGGDGTYHYNWSIGGGDVSSQNGLSAGDVTVTITDGNGCTLVAPGDTTITINEPEQLYAHGTHTDISCNGANDGSITFTPIGGDGTYHYNWSIGGGDVSSQNGLSAGDVTVTITDGNGCTLVAPGDTTITINEPEQLYAHGTHSDISCNGANDGSITFTPIGGDGTYHYNWSIGGGDVSSQNGLAGGNVTVTITDGNGCTLVAPGDTTITIDEPDAITIVIDDQVPPTCNQGTNGYINITVSGGTESNTYDYNWSQANGGSGIVVTDEDQTGLTAGDYFVTVTDDNSCTATQTITLNDPDAISYTETHDNLACNGDTSGSITITITQTNYPPVTIDITGPNGYSHNETTSTSITISNLEAGTYNLSLTDSGPCTTTGSITITEPAPIIIDGTISDLNQCYGDCTADITQNPSGGYPPYTYTWTGGLSGQSPTDVCAGTYNMTIDDGSCTKDTSYTITQPDSILITETHVNPTCNASNNGSIDITVTGGTEAGNYDYSWTGPNGFTSTSDDITNLEAGTYIVDVTDDNGCTKSLTILLSDPDAIILALTQTDITCNGYNDGTVTLDLTGGTPWYDYDILNPDATHTIDSTWNTETISGLVPGNYTVTITDQGPCDVVQNFTINEPDGILFNGIQTNITCYNDCDGIIDLNLSGGTQPYASITWSNGSSDTTLNNLCPGTYSVTVVDANGCNKDTSFTITQPDSLDAHFYDITQNVCDATCNGSATLSVTGGTVSYSYNWAPIPATINNDTSLTDLCPNTYNVTVTDNNGCTDTSSVVITEIIPITITEENLTNLSCYNVCVGSVEIEVSGTHPPLSISWNDPSNDTDTLVENLCAGNVTVTVEDINHCTKDTTFTITQPDSIEYTFEYSHLTCNGDADGSVITHVTGGTPSYTFNYGSGAGTDSTNSGLSGGTYQVTISDANSCNVPVGSYTIIEPTDITSSINIDNAPLCNGDCNGQATVTANGGSVATDYSYSWSNSQTTATATGLCAQQYTLTITDDSSCVQLDTVVIIEPQAITATYDTTQINCSGACTGEIIAHFTGGTTPYTISWSNGSNDTTLSNLCVGDFIVTLVDANSCTFTDTVTIRENNPITVNFINIVNITCNGANDGSVTAVGAGGSGSFTYAWNNGDTDSIASNLSAGWAVVTVTDDAGCFFIDSIEITQPDTLKNTLEIINPLCNGEATGNITVHATGGTQPYSFDWGSGSTVNDSIHTGLSAGTYYITITDFNGCTKQDSITLTDYPLLTANITDSTMLNCHNECIGSATVTAGGGNGAYTYNWSNTETTTVINNLCADTYIITVTDGNNCTATDSITIANPDSLYITSTNITPPYCGQSNGSISVTGNGGTPTYSYLWGANGNNEADSSISGLAVNTYTVTITDINGCTVDSTFILNDTSALTLTLVDSIPTTCSYTCDGGLTVAGGNGILPYDYQWDTTPYMDSVITDLCIGSYYATVTDNAGCQEIGLFNVTGPDTLIATVDSIHPIACNGDCNAEIEITVSGGTPQYNTTWSNGNTTTHPTDLCAGAYTVSISDSHGCTNTLDVNIIDPALLTATINDSTNVLCYGDLTGSANVHADGGSTPYTYEWTNGSTDSTVTNLGAGIQYVTVTDLGGCTAIDSVTITQGDSLYMIATLTNPACNQSNGEILVQGMGGTPGFGYQWGANASNSTDSTITGLDVNTYSITITDAVGCTIDSSIILNDTSNIDITVVDSIMATCSYTCDGSVTVVASNGIAPYQYEWSNGVSDSTITNQCVGAYQITVTDAQLCQEIRLIDITGPDSLYALIDTVIDSHCNGDCQAEIYITSVGGTPNYNYSWSNGETTEDISNLCAGNYQLILTDANNCQFAIDTLIHDPLPLYISFVDSIPLCNTGSSDGAIYANTSGGTPGYTYNWSNTDTTQNLINIDGGWYTLTVTDTVGCTLTDSTFLGAAITMTAVADSNKTICSGDTVQLFGIGTSSDGSEYTFTWTPNENMQDTTVTNPYVSVTDSTMFYFEITHSNGVCTAKDSVLIATYPILNVDAGEDQIIPYEHSTEITATGGGSSSTYQWVPDNFLDSPTDSSSGVNTITETIVYYIVVTSENGCISKDSVKVEILPELVIPNGITPNGDGINDTWEIDLIELYPNVEVEVFNRWGEQLFYSKGYPPSERWNGTYHDKKLPTGTYYYIIKLNDNVHNKPFTGPITLVR